MKPIKIIQQQDQSALVEWLEKGKSKRATIPVSAIREGQVSSYNLKLGIPYGLPWSEIIDLGATPEKLEQELHRVGIWTADDALQNANQVLGAIQATYSIDLGKIMAIAKQERSK